MRTLRKMREQRRLLSESARICENGAASGDEAECGESDDDMPHVYVDYARRYARYMLEAFAAKKRAPAMARAPPNQIYAHMNASAR